jgi:non-homologous end joining protein Ku
MTKIPSIKNYKLRAPNPLVGESEGEIKSKKLKDNYAKFIRQSIRELHRKKSEDRMKLQQQKKKDREYIFNLMQKRLE